MAACRRFKLYPSDDWDGRREREAARQREALPLLATLRRAPRDVPELTTLLVVLSPVLLALAILGMLHQFEVWWRRRYGAET